MGAHRVRGQGARSDCGKPRVPAAGSSRSFLFPDRGALYYNIIGEGEAGWVSEQDQMPRSLGSPSGAQQSKIHIPGRPCFAPHIEWGGWEGVVKKG